MTRSRLRRGILVKPVGINVESISRMVLGKMWSYCVCMECLRCLIKLGLSITEGFRTGLSSALYLEDEMRRVELDHTNKRLKFDTLQSGLH